MPEPTKKEASIKALKDSNKHLTELFSAINKNDISIAEAISMLDDIKRSAGGIMLEACVNQSRQTVTLASFIARIQVLLTEGKINA